MKGSTAPAIVLAPQQPGEVADEATKNLVWQVVQRVQQGHTVEFDQLYIRYRPTVWRFVWRRVGNYDLTQDLVADVFTRALRWIGGFSWQGADFGGWLVTIARNVVVDHFKRKSTQVERSVADVGEFDWVDDTPLARPADAAEAAVVSAAVQEALSRIPAEQRRCLQMRFLDDLSTAECARAMGRNEGAIKALQYRAVGALARQLGAGFDGRGALPARIVRRSHT